MVGVLGLLTGWVLLMPALLAIYMMLGFPYFRWMSFFLGIAGSFPMLVLTAVGGLVMIALSVRSLTRPAD
ncbi:MAG: hypothetical protein KF779_05715 [Hyphomonadaceae bacterium]|nr:hypothetical protein [Hyphomonadaceae bacterium]